MEKILCYLCGQEINGPYYYDRYGNTICALHAHAPLCLCCGRICDAKSIAISPDRHICSHCQQRKIEMSFARQIIIFIYHIYEKKGLRFPRYDVKLISVMEMVKCSESDVYTYPLGLAQRIGEIYHIYVLNVLSRIGFVDTLAHEIMHIWQWHNNIRMPSKLCEGFCNLGSYFVLSSMMTDMPTEETRVSISRLLSNKDEIYGDGFRYWKNIFDKGGWTSVIDIIATYKN